MFKCKHEQRTDKLKVYMDNMCYLHTFLLADKNINVKDSQVVYKFGLLVSNLVSKVQIKSSWGSDLF